jgi:orotidine-5'-phosphate decarboxylase
MTFLEKLEARVASANSLLCVGLDPDASKLPATYADSISGYADFSKAIVDATAEFACAFKPNSAFYEARGAAGIEELRQTCEYINQKYPDIPVILDFKRGDIGNTNDNYVQFAFEYLGADAVTIQPYLGREAVQPFLDRSEKGVIVLCRTSNSGAGEFQDILIEGTGQELYKYVAQNVTREWNTNGNCLLVVGATYPNELAEIRGLVGNDMWFLVPGVGAQGGDIQATVKAGGDKVIISSGRAILYASNGEDFADAAARVAQSTRDEINQFRGEK